MAETESTLSVELTASTDDSRFLVTNRLEIIRVLRGLAQRIRLSSVGSRQKQYVIASMMQKQS